MTKKIFQSICMVSVTVLIAAVLIIGGATYEYFDAQLSVELSQQVRLAASGVEQQGVSYLQSLPESDTRITWVDADGTVLYDTKADASGMENHLDREEIASALANGSADARRYSGTLLQRTHYHALRLSDGTVLRASSVQLSLWTVLFCMLQPILVVLALALVFGIILALRLSRRITSPLNAMDLDHPEQIETYEELRPMLEKLKAQKQQIAGQIRELKAKQAEFQYITSAMDEGIVIIDRKADILSCNTGALKLLGAAPDREVRNILSINRTEVLRSVVGEALSGQHGEGAWRDNGRYCRISGSPVFADEMVTGAVIMITDETEKERSEALRREFTANVSHELKTPLTSISGFAELIKNGLATGDDAVHFADNIYKEAGRLITLVGDIIKLSQLDSGEIPFDDRAVDLYEVSRDVLQRLENIAAQNKIDLELSGEHCTVNGNRQILEEMVCNLCDNAVKYGREGGQVRVTVAQTGKNVTLTVADNGIGIPADCQSRVFERFYRVDKSRSNAIGGTGLGLSIVKHGAAYHGAQITLESEPDQGTTVTLTF